MAVWVSFFKFFISSVQARCLFRCYTFSWPIFSGSLSIESPCFGGRQETDLHYAAAVAAAVASWFQARICAAVVLSSLSIFSREFVYGNLPAKLVDQFAIVLARDYLWFIGCHVVNNFSAFDFIFNYENFFSTSLDQNCCNFVIVWQN